MVVLALQIVAAGLAGLWAPLIELPLLAGALLVVTAWWFGGARGLLLALVCAAAMTSGVAYRDSVAAVGGYAGDVLVSGCVADFPRVGEQRIAFTFAPADTGQWPARIYVTIYDDAFAVRAAGCYDLLLRLRPAHGQGNSGQFDREIWLYRSGSAATAYVRASMLNRERHDLRPGPLLRVRAALRARLERFAIREQAAALLFGLVLGDRSGITRAQWAALRVTGTTHLVAISGLHVALVAGICGGCAWFAAGCVRASPAPWAAVAGIAAATGYALLAGWSVPTSRAAGMFLVCSLLWLACRAVPPLRVLSLAAVSAVLAGPVVLLHPGFWMSYLAVALLLSAPATGRQSASGKISKALNYFASLASAQWRLTLGLLIPGLWLFGVWAPLAPLVNLLAIPVFGLVVLPLTLVAAVWGWLALPGAPFIIDYAGRLLLVCIGQLGNAAAASGAPLRAAPGPAALALLGIGVTILLLPALRRAHLPALIALVLVLLIPDIWNWRPPRPPLRVDILDVGQGTAVLVQTRHHSVLVDAGPAWRGGDSGAMTVLPVLQAAGIDTLDLLLVTHPDNDHAGGASSIMAALPVTAVMGMPGRLRCRRGMQWTWDGVEFRVLHPRTGAGWSRNNASCVLSIRSGSARVLLPGDIELAAEAVTLARGDDLTADMVVVPHHGSRTSSDAAWVAATRSRYAVYTTGYRNRWGFPHPDVNARWEAAGSCALNTATTGQLAFVADEGGGLLLDSAYKAYFMRPAAVRLRNFPACKSMPVRGIVAARYERQKDAVKVRECWRLSKPVDGSCFPSSSARSWLWPSFWSGSGRCRKNGYCRAG